MADTKIKDVVEVLNSARNYKDFSHKITSILNQLGFNAWSYTRVDMPAPMVPGSAIGGNIDDLLDLFEKEKFNHCNIAMQQITNTNEAVYQFEINRLIKNSPLVTDSYLHAKKMEMSMAAMGYEAGYLMPMTSADGRFAFFVVSKYMKDDAFKSLVRSKLSAITSLAVTIDRIGCRKYINKFTSYERSFFRFTHSKPVMLFRLCHENDISIVEAAKIMRISPKTTEMHSKKFREMMNCHTTATAITRAIKFGFFRGDGKAIKMIPTTNRGTFSTQLAEQTGVYLR